MNAYRIFGLWVILSGSVMTFLGINRFNYAEESPGNLVNSIGMKLVPIKAGTFVMGSIKSEMAMEKDENRHEVVISHNFFIGAHEVTQGQFAKIMENDNPSFFRGIVMKKWFDKEHSTDDYPVENVNYFDARKFCQRLSELPSEKASRRIYRLPTEAEWEYACRSGTTTRFFFGDDENDLRFYAWFKGNSEDRTHNVGMKRPNKWGIYDMYGNVWEWCSDWYDASYPSGLAIDPEGPNKGALKVIRGGDWGNDPVYCRSAERDSIQPSHKGNDRGFRVVMVQDKKLNSRP